MKTIHKFSLDVQDGAQAVRMPVGAIVRAAALQGARISVWAEVDTDHEEERRTFQVIGTGHPLPDVTTTYIGMVPQGPFIWHVVELYRG